jgi:hypothetical protein
MEDGERMADGTNLRAPSGDRPEPALIVRARAAIKENPGYVAHGPELCPRDILEAYQLGLGEAASVQEPRGDVNTGKTDFLIRNPLRTVPVETAARLGELATDLECGLSAQASILSDWTSTDERNALDDAALVKLAYARFAADIRAVLGALETEASIQSEPPPPPTVVSPS